MRSVKCHDLSSLSPCYWPSYPHISSPSHSRSLSLAGEGEQSGPPVYWDWGIIKLLLQIFRERKVHHDKTSRLFIDDNEWANCRPCNRENKVTTTSGDERDDMISRIPTYSVLRAVPRARASTSIRRPFWLTTRDVDRSELINE